MVFDNELRIFEASKAGLALGTARKLERERPFAVEVLSFGVDFGEETAVWQNKSDGRKTPQACVGFAE